MINYQKNVWEPRGGGGGGGGGEWAFSSSSPYYIYIYHKANFFAIVFSQETVKCYLNVPDGIHGIAPKYNMNHIWDAFKAQ